MNVALIAQRDPIFRRICRAVPRSVESALSEDIISEIYLEIREGRLHPREIEVQARRFIAKGFASWANPWGDLSLNPRKASDGREIDFLDRIEDEGARAAFEQVTFARENEG